MAFLQIQGVDEYAEKVKKLSKNPDRIIKKAVYDGAAIVADAVKAGLRGLPVDNRFGSPEHPVNGVTRRQKADLIESMGLTPMRNEMGYINTKLGFDGYGSMPTKNYPKGVPNALLMRSVESGTTFRKKNPVVRRALNASKPLAIQKMANVIDEELRKELG